MKTLTYAIAAAGAASVEAGASKKSEWTKESLVESTRAFVRENKEHIKFISKRKLRKLTSSQGAKGGKIDISDLGGWSGSSGSSDSEHGGWSGSGIGRSGKSGKSSRTVNGDNWNNGDHKGESFYILPTSCPGQCISSDVNEDNEFKDVIKTCEHDESQKWNVLSDGSYVMIESYDRPHWCISVDYKDGDKDETFEDTCMGEYYLALKECGSYGSQWYFTGGQLISSMCWAGGLSSYMSVYLDDDKKCEDGVSVWGETPNDAIMRADTFMFVSHLPESPIEVDVDYD